MTGNETGEELSPWMAKLSPESREVVRRNVAQAPPLTEKQKARLRLHSAPSKRNARLDATCVKCATRFVFANRLTCVSAHMTNV
jgi:hypothetical protein